MAEWDRICFVVIHEEAGGVEREALDRSDREERCEGCEDTADGPECQVFDFCANFQYGDNFFDRTVLE